MHLRGLMRATLRHPGDRRAANLSLPLTGERAAGRRPPVRQEITFPELFSGGGSGDWAERQRGGIKKGGRRMCVVLYGKINSALLTPPPDFYLIKKRLHHGDKIPELWQVFLVLYLCFFVFVFVFCCFCFFLRLGLRS